MTDMIIDGSVVFLFSTVVGWLVYLTIRIFENKQSIAVTTQMNVQMSEEVKRFYDRFESFMDLYTSDRKEAMAEIKELRIEILKIRRDSNE